MRGGRSEYSRMIGCRNHCRHPFAARSLPSTPTLPMPRASPRSANPWASRVPRFTQSVNDSSPRATERSMPIRGPRYSLPVSMTRPPSTSSCRSVTASRAKAGTPDPARSGTSESTKRSFLAEFPPERRSDASSPKPESSRRTRASARGNHSSGSSAQQAWRCGNSTPSNTPCSTQTRLRSRCIRSLTTPPVTTWAPMPPWTQRMVATL